MMNKEVRVTVTRTVGVRSRGNENTEIGMLSATV